MATNKSDRQMPLTAEGLDEVLVQIEFGVAKLEAAMANIVKKSKAEFELARRFDDVSNFIDRLLAQRSGREQLRAVFAGDDCKRLARLCAVCRNVVLSGTNDQRRRGALKSLAKVERVIKDLGFVGELQVAVQAEEAALKRALSSESVDIADAGAIQHLADASMAGSEAVAAEWEGDVASALNKYNEAQSSLAAMIALGRAVSKLKGLIGKGEAAVAEDVERLVSYKEQIVNRMEHLAGLPEGEQSSIPVEEHIQPPILELLCSPRKWKMVICHCARKAVDTGSELLGPFTGMLARGMQAAWRGAKYVGGRLVVAGANIRGRLSVVGRKTFRFLQDRSQHVVANAAFSLSRLSRESRRRSQTSRRSIERDVITTTLGPRLAEERPSQQQPSTVVLDVAASGSAIQQADTFKAHAAAAEDNLHASMKQGLFVSERPRAVTSVDMEQGAEESESAGWQTDAVELERPRAVTACVVEILD